MARITLEDLDKAVRNKTPFPMVKRPEYGSLGRSVNLGTNLFRVKFKLPEKIHQYDVRITEEGRENEDYYSDKRHRDTRIKIYKKLLEQAPELRGGAWDTNKQLFLNVRVDKDEEPKSYHIDLSDSRGGDDETASRKKTKRSAVVIIKYARTIQTRSLEQLLSGAEADLTVDPREVLQALDIALSCNIATRMTAHGRCFYSDRGARRMDRASDIWLGFFQSLRPGVDGLFLNLDITAGLFVKEDVTLADYLADLFQTDVRNLTQRASSKDMFKAIKPMIFELTHRVKPPFKAHDVTRESAANLEFELEKDRRTTVQKYFANRDPSIKLKYPELPCIQVNKKFKDQTFIEYYPMEVVRLVPRRRWSGKTEQRHVDSIRNAIARKPSERLSSIIAKLKEAHHAGTTAARSLTSSTTSASRWQGTTPRWKAA